jgi:ABC-type nitrate/sulfonate/bicarbonate transport system ATPase subunit
MTTDARTMRAGAGQPQGQADLYRPASSILELRSMSCAYEPARPAVHDISFMAREGEILCLLGPSGCGKTTILRAIAGFEPVRSGEIFLSGRLVSSSGHTVPTEERHVGMVFQEYALFPHLRVADNIAFGLHHLSKGERRSRVHDMLCLTGLEGFERRYPHELSGGQQQRVALSRALVQNPVVLLLDEPFSNLDPDMASRMRQELHGLLRRMKTTTILVTHDHDEAFAMADRIARPRHAVRRGLRRPSRLYPRPSPKRHGAHGIGRVPGHPAERGGDLGRGDDPPRRHSCDTRPIGRVQNRRAPIPGLRKPLHDPASVRTTGAQQRKLDQRLPGRRRGGVARVGDPHRHLPGSTLARPHEFDVDTG